MAMGLERLAKAKLKTLRNIPEKFLSKFSKLAKQYYIQITCILKKKMA